VVVVSFPVRISWIPFGFLVVTLSLPKPRATDHVVLDLSFPTNKIPNYFPLRRMIMIIVRKYLRVAN
jgi:hypothetical protein